ncbi:MAG: ATP-binding protein [Candidatus Omnitrophota bacterium]
MFLALGFRKRVIAAYLSLFILIYILTGIFLFKALKQQMLAQLQDSMKTEVRLLAHTIPGKLLTEKRTEEVFALTHELGSDVGLRLTLIDAEGTVLGDSEETFEALTQMENHASRPEVREALQGRIGASVRFSMTLNREMLYVAGPILDEGRLAGVMRVAVPLHHVHMLYNAIRKPMLVGAAAGIAVILVIGILMGGRLTRRVGELVEAARRYGAGDLTSAAAAMDSDELNVLATSMRRMAAALQKRIEELEIEKTKLGAVLDHMIEGVLAVDRANCVLMANPAVAKMFRTSHDQMIGRSLMEITRNPKIDQMMREAVQSSGVVAQEIELGLPERSVLRGNAIGISKTEGALCGILVLHDVTDVRRLENLRRDFVANVSHELRTPLTSIRGFLETLLTELSSGREQEKHFLQMMQEDTDRLTRLIDDLLELSKIESGEVPLSCKRLDLRAEIGKVLEASAPSLARKKIRIDNAIGAEPAIFVSADPDRLQQVLVNLVDNAVKFNKEGGLIRFSACRDGAIVRVEIEDTGIGIPEKVIPRIFERFFRADKARSRELGGTGLGLAIVKHIIEAHSGAVHCSSRLGQGSVFSFTLPAAS